MTEETTTAEPRRRLGFVWFGAGTVLLVAVVGVLIWARSTTRPPDHSAALRAAAVVRAHRPHLHLIVDDVLKARGSLLKGRDIAGGGFHPYVPNETQLPPFTGKCDTLADPNLSALTATAVVQGRVWANVNSGAEFLPSAYVFPSAAQAARAQTLETGPDYVPCEVALIKQRLEGIPYTITGRTRRVIARSIDGVTVRGQQVILSLTVKPKYPIQVESSFMFFRHGRALFELRTSTPWNPVKPIGTLARREWRDAIDATARRLRRSGF